MHLGITSSSSFSFEFLPPFGKLCHTHNFSLFDSTRGGGVYNSKFSTSSYFIHIAPHNECKIIVIVWVNLQTSWIESRFVERVGKFSQFIFHLHPRTNIFYNLNATAMCRYTQNSLEKLTRVCHSHNVRWFTLWGWIFLHYEGKSPSGWMKT